MGYVFKEKIALCCSKIATILNQNKVKRLLIEINADMSKGIKRDLRESGYMGNVFYYREVVNKENKISHFAFQAINKKIFKMLRETDSEYINQVLDYTGEHRDMNNDDAPDSLACMARYIMNRDYYSKNRR